MTEYELAALFYQVVDVANATMANFLAVTFGMMVVCYLAAHKLDRASAIVVLALYSLNSLGMINEIYSEYSDMVRIGKEIAQSATGAGSRLSWHGFALAGPDSYLQYIPFWVLAMSGLGFLATLWFFFHMRRRRGAAS
jgi:hypothetical protein